MATLWKCGCGWVMGQIEMRQLILYSHAVHGNGIGDVPDVLTVLPEVISVPVKCTHCGRQRTWNGSADKLAEVLERSLRRPLTEEEKTKLYGGVNG